MYWIYYGVVEIIKLKFDIELVILKKFLSDVFLFFIVFVFNIRIYF